MRLQDSPELPHSPAYLCPIQPLRGLPADPLPQPGLEAQPDLGWPPCCAVPHSSPFQLQPGASLRGHTSPGPARVKAAERRGFWADVALSLKVVPSDEDGRACGAETRAPAQLGLGEVPVRAACPLASLGPSPAVTRALATGTMELGWWTQLGLTFLQLLLISSLPRGTVSRGASPFWGLVGSGMG